MVWSKGRLLWTCVAVFLVGAVVAAVLSARTVYSLYLAHRMSTTGEWNEYCELRERLSHAATEEMLLKLGIPHRHKFWPFGNMGHVAMITLGMKDTPKAHKMLESLLRQPEYANMAIHGLAYAESYDQTRLFERYRDDEHKLWVVVVGQIDAGRRDSMPQLRAYMEERGAELNCSQLKLLEDHFAAIRSEAEGGPPPPRGPTLQPVPYGP